MATRETNSTTRRTPSVETTPEPKRHPRPPAVTTRKKREPAPHGPVALTPPEHIRLRAYYLFLERNGGAADPLADWLRAEREVTR